MKSIARIIIGFGFLTSASVASANATLEFCPGPVSGAVFDVSAGFRNFVCRDRHLLHLTTPGSYQLDRNGNLVTGSFSSPQVQDLFTLYTGFAEFVDPDPEDCTVINVTATDTFSLVPGDGNDEVITRRFSAECGGVVSPDLCFQEIVIEDCDPSELVIGAPMLAQWGLIILVVSLFFLAASSFSGLSAPKFMQRTSDSEH